LQNSGQYFLLLIIREFSELDDKTGLLLLGEQKYDVKSIESAIKKEK